MEMVDWSKLPYDIIHKVASHIPVIEDFLAFSAVCTSWRSVHLAKQWRPGTNVPVLMFSDDGNSRTRSFLSLYTSKVCNSELPGARGKRWWGSSTGWLVTIGRHYEIRLLNPFTRASINLPHHSSLKLRFGDLLNWYELMERAFVFRTPSTSAANEDLVVVVLFGTMKQLAFCRPGYTSWICLKHKVHSEIVDVVCVKDKIYALSLVGHLLHVDIDGNSLTSIGHHSPTRDIALSLLIGGWDRLSMVESSGELWLVCQNQPDKRLRPISFMVYWFSFEEMEWSRLRNLGDHTIFLTDNSCICVSAPHYSNCEGNSVYFVTSKREKGWPNRVTRVDVGLHSMGSKVSVPFCIRADIQNCISFPAWVMPSLL